MEGNYILDSDSDEEVNPVPKNFVIHVKDIEAVSFNSFFSPPLSPPPPIPLFNNFSSICHHLHHTVSGALVSWVPPNLLDTVDALTTLL